MSDGIDLNDDDSLFDYPSPEDDCPICFIRYPIETEVFMTCCAKSFCSGCYDVMSMHTVPPCPFCREPAPKTNEVLHRLEKLAEKGNPAAIGILGSTYSRGKGVPKDIRKAIELWTKAAELGHLASCSVLGDAYNPLFNFVFSCGLLGDAYNPMFDNGMGLEKDWEKCTKYYNIAAKGGHLHARSNLACLEYHVGNIAAATKHIIIAASMGHDYSLIKVKQAYIRGEATKDQFASTLRAHKDAKDEMISSHRPKNTFTLSRS